MGDFSLAVELREGTGKGFARKLRAEGRVPAVLYGHGKSTVSLTFNPSDLEMVLKKSDAGVNTLIDLAGAGQVSGRVVLVKELQRHPVRGTLVHADLFEIDKTERLQVTVPIHLVGTPAGVKLGGTLEHSLREVDLSCLPASIPDSIDVDVRALEIGDTLHLSDMTLPEGTEMLADETLPIAHVSAARVEEEEPVEEEVAEVTEEAPSEAEAETE